MHAVKNGSTILLAHVWPDAPREFEKYVKSYGGAVRYCPICNINDKLIPTVEVFNRRKEKHGDQTLDRGERTQDQSQP